MTRQAAARQGMPANRVSFVDALALAAAVRPGEPVPVLVVNPTRPGRTEPRVRKRRPKQ